MAFGKVYPKFRSPMRKVVEKKLVVDLGAGDLYLSDILLKNGAASVLAIEPHEGPYAGMTCQQATATHTALFNEPRIGVFPLTFLEALKVLPPTIQVGFLSWPMNRYLKGLVEILERCETVVYMGRNDEFTSCGWPELFQHLFSRELVSSHEGTKNDMLIYGAPLKAVSSPRCREEKGMEKLVSYYGIGYGAPVGGVPSVG